MLKIEPFDVYSVVNGSVWLDGGAMFGVVPKALWESVTEVDERNRILLKTRTLLAVDRSRSRVILTDTGCGTKWSRDKADRFGIWYDPEAIPSALASLGLAATDVTDVFISHLHFDHNGGLTCWEDQPEGPTRPTFPRARHWVHRGHWEHAHQPSVKDRASFLVEDYDVLEQEGLLRFVEGVDPDPPFDGVTWFVSNGHTPYQLHPVFGVGPERLMFIGDLVPTAAHLRLSWVMAYDLQPMTTIAERESIYRRCLNEGLLLAFPHDPETGGVAIEGTVEKPVVARKLLL
jgi:glyoxylase-like metal-dependent hydrolase (beta-lactamase superfamily II)